MRRGVSTRSWRMRTALPWLLVGGAQFALCKESPSINVALRTSFAPGPYLVELLETAAQENSSCYFPLLDRVADGHFADQTTEQELYTAFTALLQQDGHLTAPESLSSFKLALSLRAAAPRVAAHFHYYNTSVQPQMMAAQDAACPVWVYFDGQQYCSPSLDRAQQPVHLPDAADELPFDRILGPPDGAASILYADITHPLFGQFHSVVSQTARDAKTSYRVRYRPSIDHPADAAAAAAAAVEADFGVSGYGVELVLKRTDYIVIDDRDRDDQKADPAKDATLDQVDEDEMADLKPLTTSEVVSLGLKAASYIAASDDPLESLLQVTSDFPKYSSLLAAKNASAEFVTEHRANRGQFLPAGYNIFWINGVQIEPRRINAYSLLDHLRRERRIIADLRDIGLSATEARKLLSHEVIADAQSNDTPQRFEWRDAFEPVPVLAWLNDLEQDQRYAQWPTSLRTLFQRVYPGQLPQLARDIHNLVVPIDLTDIRDIELVAASLQSVVKRSVPLRIAIVPAGSGELAETYARLSYHVLDTYGLSTLMKFFAELVAGKKLSPNAEKPFAAAIAGRKVREGHEALTYQQVLRSEQLKQRLEARDAYFERLALSGPNPPFIINGVVLPRTDNWFEILSQRLFQDLTLLQQAVYEEAVSEDAWVPEFFIFQAATRRNEFVFPHNPKDIKIVDVIDLSTRYSQLFAGAPKLGGAEVTMLSDRAHLLVLADLDSPAGQALVKEALFFHSNNPEAELLFLHNSSPGPESTEVSSRIYDLVRDGVSVVSAEQLDRAMDGSGDAPSTKEESEQTAEQFWTQAQSLAGDLGLAPGENGLWLNGRVLGPLSTKSFSAADLDALLQLERSERIAPVTAAIAGLDAEDKFNSALDLAKVTSLVARSLKSDLPEGIRESAPLIRTDRFKVWNGTHTSINIENSEDAAIQVVALVDPASELVQQWVPVLKVLAQLAGVNVQIFLNPLDRLSELPVKRFYRQVLQAEPQFDQAGGLITPTAHFKGIPKDTLFNLGMVVPPSWLVAPKYSKYDLDNIKLSSVDDGDNIDAVYELEHILIEGHSREVATSAPPRGAQLLLGTAQEPHFTDTIVMANLGYFQFKANPGYWQISLKPGRSSKIFSIDSAGQKGYAPHPGDETTSVALLSFQGLTLFPRLSRKPGMEEEDVLEATTGGAMDYLNKGASFASSALSSLGFKQASSTNADINIFSVASGHLYERMLNIMMVSVMKHTKHTVKFWFIEQFLSHSFKSTLPHLAEHYGFEYEMVTYKWPHWLRGQKEKQREIWGYKILFLDVLFPLDLDKVIFVDADQIVRTDMMELNKVDLKGAPYGFTPMCDSRTEMEGFRFWKQGYWENYLRGKPYHISALYVVDLKRFRQLAAGDRLRQQYQALSSDPASLSNLDQDLPNHMQHNLPIFSLPQEWLWCETWCSDESLSNAKTIDLCNNPMTKEPKLDRARRQVPEWTVYDEEIASVIRQAEGETLLGTAADGADTRKRDEL